MFNALTWYLYSGLQIIKQYFHPYFKYARHKLIILYTSYIRSVLTYASPAFFYTLPLYWKKDLENVEKRALSIICPGLAYGKAIELSNIMSINDYIATSLSSCKLFTNKLSISISHVWTTNHELVLTTHACTLFKIHFEYEHSNQVKGWIQENLKGAQWS